jgi:TATA-box binding protein (TBP) (component of TFIID and TFIIIB)
MSREAWKRWWRAFRIVRREEAKARQDMLIFGSGVVLVTGGDEVARHIPLNEVTFRSNA